MAPKDHPTPLSGGDRKALNKELGKARAMANILAAQSAEMRAKGEGLIQQADKLLCESWNERMWSDGEPIDPSPTIDQAINGGFPLAGDPMRPMQDAERRRPRGDEAPADDLRTRPRQSTPLSQMRQSWPTSVGDPATVGMAAAAPSNRTLNDVQPLLDHHQPGRHYCAVSRGQPVRRHPGANGRRVSGLQGTDRPLRSRGSRSGRIGPPSGRSRRARPPTISTRS
jgi:hypothetical protein